MVVMSDSIMVDFREKTRTTPSISEAESRRANGAAGRSIFSHMTWILAVVAKDLGILDSPSVAAIQTLPRGPCNWFPPSF